MVGSQAIQQYLGSIRNIFDIQKRQGLITIEKGSLMTDRVKDLIKLVGNHKEGRMKLLHKERVDKEFQPFQLVEEVPKIEAELWNVSAMREMPCCVVLELDEVTAEDLRATGNWSSDVFGDYYDVSS